MKYTVISDKKISQMSLGTVQLGMNYGIANEYGKPNTKQSFSMLETALKNGITSMDTARDYGESEDVLGAFFKETQCELPFLTTKILTTLPAGSSPLEIEKELYRSIEASIEKLGVKKVNCIMLHSADDMIKHGNIVPDILCSMVKKGYTDIVGVSVYRPNEVDTMLENDLYRAIQVPINLFDQKLLDGGYIDRLNRSNICVFVRSVFLQGLFFLDPDKITDPVLTKFAVPYLNQLRYYSELEGLSISEFAISYIRDIKGITSLVLGADTKEQVLENIRCLNVKSISEKTRGAVRRAFKNVDLPEIMTVLSKQKTIAKEDNNYEYEKKQSFKTVKAGQSCNVC